MKLLRVSSLFLFSFLAFSYIKAAETEFVNPKSNCDGIKYFKSIGEIKPKDKNNKLQAVKFTIIDSLANSLSYLNDKQSPFVWDAVHNHLVTIKRGSHEVTEPDYNSSNSKNNLFIRTSSNLGKTWAPPLKVYDKDFWKFGEARFPSISVAYENNKPFYYMTFALIIEAQGLWKGWGNGIYGNINGADNPVWSANEKFTSNGKDYKWGQFYYTATNQPSYSASDAKLMGWQKDGTINIFAVGGAAPTPIGSKTDNNNFAFRKVVDFDDQLSTYAIPPTWNSTKFDPVDTTTSRSNELIGFKKDASGKMYFGVFGNFNGTKSDSARNECGVSTSSDNGTTWSEFEIFPYQLIRDYVTKTYSSINQTNFFMAFYSKDLVVFDNGDYSYVVSLIEGANNSKLPGERQHIALELYKENGVFGVRSISNRLSAGTINLYDHNKSTFATNSKDYELQASRSADGSYLLAKWVHSYSEYPTDTTFRQASSDIFASLRNRGSNVWTKPQNITNDSDAAAIHIGVWIPDLLPNDKKNIPILECTGAGSTSLQELASYLKKQYVMFGNFDADTFTDVNDEKIYENNLNVYPNPSNDKSTITFSLANGASLDLTITDMAGRNVYSQNSISGQAGLNAIYLDTKKFENGVYLVNLNSNNIKLTQKLNVIK